VAIWTRTLAELNQVAFDHLLRNTDGKITLLSPGSIARALVESANRNLEGYYEALSVNHAQAFLSQASGPYLDLHGALFGVRRREPTMAWVAREDNAIRFYVATGTLYDRLPKAGDVSRGMIPKGTTVTSADGTIAYTVEENVIFDRSATEVYAPARAQAVGTAYNVGAHVLRKHSLAATDVYVTNPVSISTGTQEESDSSYRARISAAILVAQRANESSIRLAALSAPGVADVRLVPFKYGAGSFKIVVIPIGNRVPVDTLEMVRRNVETVAAFGIYFTVAEPKYRRFSVVVSLALSPGSSESDRDVARASAERAILDYVGEIQMGGTLVITALGAAIRASDERIFDYQIQALCIDGKHQLLHNVQLRDDELFLPDTGLSDPVRVV
jgi:uncharacterized phage protein gp47/JayE